MSLPAHAAAVLGGIVTAAAAATAVAGPRWNRAARRAAARLAEAAPDDGRLPSTFSPNQLAGLPEPVVRYFTFALTPGQPFFRRARIEQLGEFAMRPGRWSAMLAEQHVSVLPPGFVWNASIRLAPGLTVRVRDGYLVGDATMRAAVAGFVPIVTRRNSPGLAEGALLRYLAEAMAVPTALLPAAGVRWTPIDQSTARATLTDAGVTVWMDAHFGAHGKITHLTAERYRDVNGTGVPTPFVGRAADYRSAHGMMVPMSSEATWQLPEGPFTFFRARMERMEYDEASCVHGDTRRAGGERHAVWPLSRVPATPSPPLRRQSSSLMRQNRQS
jgi:hypothetical protein